ncbi:glycosyltransferase [Flavobacterium chungnamense]|uniref:Glycosyl transferase family 1 domain-containing protein n=1 Tax=Flavobacterium chungnamense TaxID=706182 RepID=A0ABP7UVL2_9FLAO
MRLTVLTKQNPFSTPGASSNRLLGLLNGLLNFDYKITLLITGGYYSLSEKTLFKKQGIHEGLNYVYLSEYENTSLNKRRLYEYGLKHLTYLKIKKNYKKYFIDLNTENIIWIKNDIINFKVVNSLEKTSLQSFFMEINEFPDIHLHNNSTRFFWQTSAANKTNAYFEGHILKKLDGLALMTQTLCDYFKDKIGLHTEVIHLPMTVDLERFDLNLSYPKFENVKAPYIAFLGSMNDAKDGVNILIESFREIAAKYPDIHLCLFGFWTYDTGKHLSLIKKAKLEKRILYAKAIDAKDVIKVVMNAKLLVLPRPDSYQAKGGFPTKLGEYLATCKPVVATRVGEIPFYLKDNDSVFFCEPSSVSSLTTALELALSNEELAYQVGVNGRKVAETIFNKDVQAKRLNSFFHEIKKN